MALAGLGLLSGAAQAQSTSTTDANGTALEPVVITGSTRERKLVDAPYAITAIDANTLRSSGPMVNLSEALARVPGLTVANRSNYAQDLQISSRGFGARAGFGVRGLRMYADGIPATMPDGQGQVAHFDLAGAQRVEVLRGPFSALYGNSSGGVIALFSAPVTEPFSEVGVDFGSFGLRQQRVAFGSPVGNNVDISAGISHFEIEGFRPHSAASRDLANVRLGWQGQADRLVLQASNQDQQADDPLGADAAHRDDPHYLTPQADQFKTRKTINQTQVGLAWTHQLGLGALDSLAMSTYAGSRGVVQYLAIPAATQNGVRHGGGLIDFDRTYSGLDTRLNWRMDQLDLVTGVNVEQMVDDRRGYLSFTTLPTDPNPDYGNRGALKRDERNRAISREAYAQAEWKATTDVSATLGLRNGQVALSTADHFPTPFTAANGDDSGALKFKYNSPVLGLRVVASPAWTLHLSHSRGFETPTLGELAYQAAVPPATVPPAGFNTNLKAQTSRQTEFGAKWRGGKGLPDIDAAAFDIRTQDEIAVLTNTGGRSSFQNVGVTSRRGFELSTRWRPLPSLSTQLSFTRLEAKYLDSFTTCRNTPCQVATASAGNRIAGTQPTSAYAEVAWKTDPVGELALEVRGQGRTPVNDLNDDFAGGFAIASLRYSRRIPLGTVDQLELLTRVDNVANRAYTGSVIVNDGNNRFFEAGAPRAYLASLRWRHSW
jgi:iron complex outermembrane receptor protein